MKVEFKRVKRKEISGTMCGVDTPQPIQQTQATSLPVTPPAADPVKPVKSIDGTGVMAQVLKVFKVPKLGRKPPSAPVEPISIGHPEMGPVNHAPIEAGPSVPAEIEVIPEMPEVSAEVAEHVEAVERGEIQLPEPVVMPQAMPAPGAILTTTPVHNIIWPVTRDDFQAGAKKPVSTSWRWLVEWVSWIIKKHPGRVLYRS